MGRLMEKVKRLLDAGLSIPSAVKESLGMSVREFADKHGVQPAHVSAAINGAMRPTESVLAAFIEELGGSEFEWRMMLWEAGKPEPTTT
jgi:transcriptional regulator with XRE-family HTH domain